MDEHSGAENLGKNNFTVTETDSLQRRTLLFLVQNMRRFALEEQINNSTNNTAVESRFPVPAKYLECQPGMLS